MSPKYVNEQSSLKAWTKTLDESMGIIKYNTRKARLLLVDTRHLTSQCRAPNRKNKIYMNASGGMRQESPIKIQRKVEGQRIMGSSWLIS